MKTNRVLAFVITGILSVTFAMAAQPPGAGNGQGERNEKKGKSENHKSAKGADDRQLSRDSTGPVAKRGEHFGDQHRIIVQNYYHEQFRVGRCPPGLAKKRNGCMPPGQAKKWTIGRPLPRDVVFHHVPQELVVQIGQPPRGYRYVRVASDILLIAIGTAMVIDAIQDLGKM